MLLKILVKMYHDWFEQVTWSKPYQARLSHERLAPCLLNCFIHNILFIISTLRHITLYFSFTRLDQLCYAMFKCNELYDQRFSRLRLNLDADHRFSQIYAAMVRLHPSDQVVNQVQVVVNTNSDSSSSWTVR